MASPDQTGMQSQDKTPLEHALLSRLQDPVLEVNGQLEPVGAFERNLGRPRSMASVNDYLFVTRSGGDRMDIYDRQGRLVSVNNEGSEFGVDLKKLFQVLNGKLSESHYYTTKLVWKGNSVATGSYDVAKALDSINEPVALAPQVSEYLSRKITSEDYGSKELINNVLDEPHFLPYFNGNTSVHLDASGEVASFKTGRCVVSFKVKDDSGASLAPKDWKRIDVRDVATITSDVIEESPYLAPFLTRMAGEVLAGGNFRAGLKESVLAVYDNEHDVCVFSDKAVNYSIDPKNPNRILYIRPDSNELVTLDAASLGLGRNPITVQALPIEGDFEDIAFDPFGNYILVTAANDEGLDQLHIIDVETLQPACLPIDGVSGELAIGDDGTVYFTDSENNLRKVSTNLHYLSEGGRDHIRKARLEHLDQLDEAVKTLRLPRLQEEKDAVDPVKLEMAEKIRGIQEKLAQRFDRLLERADSPEGVQTLRKQIHLLEQRPDFSQYPELFDVYKDRIREREIGFEIIALKEGLENLKQSLDPESTFQGSHEEISDAIQEMSRLEGLRRELRIDNKEERRAVQTLLDETRGQLTETLSGFRGGLEVRIDQLLESISFSIASSESPEELEAVMTEGTWQEFDALCRLSGSTAQSTEWKLKRDALWDAKEKEFEALEDKSERQRERRESEAVRELVSLRARIKRSLDRIDNNVELGSWRVSNPLFKNFRERLLDVSDELKSREEQAVERLIKDREQTLLRRGTVKLIEKNGVVNFGGRPFPVFADYSVLPQARIVPIHKGASTGRLVFECHGRQYEVSGELPLNLQHDEVQQAIGEHGQRARDYFEARKRKVPTFRDSWVINEYVLGNLSEMSRLLSVQQKLGQGILILESEAGVGKNVLIDIFGHFTNREVFTFSCNEDTEKEDLTQAFMFDPQRGTYRASSELLEAIQTPGSIVIFDEINTLRPGASKLLNSLFDYRRSLNLPHDEQSVEAQDCLFVGAMNLRHYIGTKQMPQEFVSRSRIKKLDYPPEKVHGRYAPYEAEIVAGNIDVLRELSQEEFYKAWDYVVNNERSNGADSYVSADREKAIRDLHHVVKVANKIREAYNAYQAEESTEEVTFVYTMRENEWIAAELNEGLDVLEAIKDVVLPKIGDPKERERVEVIINNV